MKKKTAIIVGTLLGIGGVSAIPAGLLIWTHIAKNKSIDPIEHIRAIIPNEATVLDVKINPSIIKFEGYNKNDYAIIIKSIKNHQNDISIDTEIFSIKNNASQNKNFKLKCRESITKIDKYVSYFDKQKNEIRARLKVGTKLSDFIQNGWVVKNIENNIIFNQYDNELLNIEIMNYSINNTGNIELRLRFYFKKEIDLKSDSFTIELSDLNSSTINNIKQNFKKIIDSTKVEIPKESANFYYLEDSRAYSSINFVNEDQDYINFNINNVIVRENSNSTDIVIETTGYLKENPQFLSEDKTFNISFNHHDSLKQIEENINIEVEKLTITLPTFFNDYHVIKNNPRLLHIKNFNDEKYGITIHHFALLSSNEAEIIISLYHKNKYRDDDYSLREIKSHKRYIKITNNK